MIKIENTSKNGNTIKQTRGNIYFFKETYTNRTLDYFKMEQCLNTKHKYVIIFKV